MTYALTATKTPQLSSQGVPDVILVLNKQEKYEKNRTEKQTTKKKKNARTSKGTCTCTRSSTSKGTHKQKGTCSYTKSILYHCRKMKLRKKNIYKFQKNKCSMLPVVNSQSRVFQNDSKYCKSELQGTQTQKNSH